jgi:hypothetical protein
VGEVVGFEFAGYWLAAQCFGPAVDIGDHLGARFSG